jgi:hypothetical protein
MSGAETAEKEPLIWVLTGLRAGDNAQARALAAAVARRCGGRVSEKPLRWRLLRILPNWLLPPTLAVLPAEAREGLRPPWPDLIIGVGRRAVPVARWVQRAARRQGRCVRIVWLGRPRAPLRWFDLVLTTAQYGLPPVPNVVLLDLPPTPPPAPEDETCLARWRKTWADLPRPLSGVLVGGAKWPLIFDAAAARRLGETVMSLVEEEGGAWIVSTSPRTGIRQARALHEALRRPGYFYYWRAEWQPPDNPHRALLALASRFVVTADSATMIAEAVRSGREVRLFPLRRSRLAPRWRAERGLMRWLAEQGLLSPPRDMEAFCARLVARGLARWAEEGGRKSPGGGRGVAARDRSAERAEEPSGDGSAWRERTLDEAIARIARLVNA